MNGTILVIDDDEAVRDAFIIALHPLGHHVRVAEDGPRGLVLAQEQRPDLVFLDLKMPGLHGVEVLRELNALYDDLNVYIVTGFYQEFFRELRDARAAGLHFEIASKPLSGEQIRAVASGVLGEGPAS